MNCVLFAKWIKFSVKNNKTLQKYWNNGEIFLKSQGILSVQKSGGHDWTPRKSIFNLQNYVWYEKQSERGNVWSGSNLVDIGPHNYNSTKNGKMWTELEKLRC